jgi:hypothetical protein
MADFQYLPSLSDPFVQLKRALNDWDGNLNPFLFVRVQITVDSIPRQETSQCNVSFPAAMLF